MIQTDCVTFSFYRFHWKQDRLREAVLFLLCVFLPNYRIYMLKKCQI